MKSNSIEQNIPSGWKRATLAMVSDIIMGQSPDSSSYNKAGEGLPFFQGKADFTDTYKTIIRQWTSEPTKIAESADTLISVRAPVGDVAVNNVRACIGRGLAAVRARQKITDQVYLFYVLQSLKTFFNTKAQGSTFTAINGPELRKISILLPPIKEQQKIAEILGTVDEDIAKTQEVIEATEKLKRGLMQQLFTRGIRDAEFKVLKLGDLCIFKTGKLNSNKAVDGGAYPFFTCSQETFAIDQYSFDQKAILLAGNNAAGKYSVKYYDGKFDAYQRTYVISIKNEDHLSYSYLKEVLNTRLNELRDSSVGSTTKFLTLKLLENLPISLPPISEQREIAEILASINEKISVNKKLKEKFTLLKKGLMQDLLSGQVRTV